MTRRKVFLFMTAVLLIILTVQLSAAAVRIWREGSARRARNPLEAVYTPENVEKQLLRISPLLFAVIGMTAAGLLLGIRDDAAVRPVPAPEAERNRLLSRLEAPGEEIQKARKRQRICRWGRRAAFAACMIPVLVYCADRGHFPGNDLEDMIASLALHTAPWAAAGLAILLAGTLLEERSIRREIEAARAQLKAEKGERRKTVPAGGVSAPGTAVIRVILLLAAGVLIVLGAQNGSLKDVLLKAINICTECIGLG